MVGVWALRLGSYLVSRIMSTGKDARFDDVKDKPGMFWVYWTMQVRRIGSEARHARMFACAGRVRGLVEWRR